MNYLATKTRKQPQHNQSESSRFRYSSIALALALAGITMLSPNPVYAADDKADDKTISELQAEVARISAENARLRQELENSKNGVAQQATTPEGQAVPAPAPTAANPAGTGTAAAEPIALDAVVIHSPKRIELKQDVPQSVSLVTGAELANLEASDVKSIVARVGNVSWNQGNQRTQSLSIRGIGKIGQLEAMDPSVLLIADGVSLAFNPITSSYNFTDVDTVEVSRGPQGTDGGKNSDLGKITLNTNRPSFTPSSSYALTVGQNDTVIGEFMMDNVIKEDLLAYRADLSVQKGAGYLTNVYAYSSDRTYGNTDRLTGRIQFLLTPSDDFSARLDLNKTPDGGEYTNNVIFNTPTPNFYANGASNATTNDVRVQRTWFTQDPTYTYANNYLSQSVLNIDGGYPVISGSGGGTIDLNWNLGQFTVNSTTAYKDYHFNAKNDEGTPFAISTTGGVNDNYRQISQEISLANKPGGFVDYKMGVFIMQETVDYTSFSNWLQDAGAWYASNAQYKTLNANGNGQVLMENSVNGMYKEVVNNILNNSTAVYAQAKWHLSEPLTLTTGLRLTEEDRQDPSSTLIIDNGVGAALNPVSLGGFNSTSTGALGTNTAAQTALANAVALKYFGVATYAGLSAAQQAQVAAAKSLRATQIGTLFALTTPTSFQKTQPTAVFSPSYKFNDNLTSYVSFQHGEKAGISQVINGEDTPALAEKTNAYEWGVKSSLLDKTLVFNFDFYLMNVQNYQQSVRVVDPASDPANPTYITYTGNAPKVRSQGLELDTVYSGIPHTTLRFSGAVVSAKYTDFANSPQPAENANLTTPANLTGETLAGASHVSWNLGADYHIPVFVDKVFHVDSNTAYLSRYNSDTALSSYAWIPNSWTTDLGVGLGLQNKSFDMSLIVKNAFNNTTPQAQTWNSVTPAIPRWVGVQFSGKL